LQIFSIILAANKTEEEQEEQVVEGPN